MLLLANLTAGVLLAAGLTLITAILLRRSRRPIKSRHSNPRSHSTLPTTTTSRAPSALDRMQVELFDTARDMKAELDSKMSALAVLVRSAQVETVRLEAAIDRAVRLGVADCRDPLDVLESLGEDAAVYDEFSPTTATSPPHERQTAAIRSLAGQGRAALDIARELSLPVGDVEFLLSLSQP